MNENAGKRMHVGGGKAESIEFRPLVALALLKLPSSIDDEMLESSQFTWSPEDQ